MSRLMGILITLVHIIGGSLTGYYAYFLRMQVEGGAVLDVETLIGYVSEYPMFLVGPMLIIITILVHRFEIMHARAEHRRAELLAHRMTKQCMELSEKRAEDADLIRWVRNAVDEAVIRDRKRAEVEAEAEADAILGAFTKEPKA